MKILEKRPFQNAMAFYHKDGLPAAWKQAMQFAGEGGRLATMPDIVAARLATKPGDAPWETYYTTLSAEYLGFSKKTGKRILIVAHGVGPMSTLDGILKAYGWEFKDKSRSRNGGRITQQEFWDLEAGKYGEVYIVDFDSYCRGHSYPFLETLRERRARIDPVLKARFGLFTEQYVAAHAEHARHWHLEQAGIDPENKYDNPNFEKYLDRRRSQHLKDGIEGSNPYIIKVEGAANCHYGSPQYGYRDIEKGYALAHLLSTGSLTHLHHEGSESLVLDVGCHEWWNGVRLVGIKDSDVKALDEKNRNKLEAIEARILRGATPGERQAARNRYVSVAGFCTDIHSGPDAYWLLRKNWRDLLIPVFPPDINENIGLRGLVQIDEQWFTQYPKPGDGMDTWEPEYVVTAMEKVGDPVLFRTHIAHYHGFFKFSANEVQAITPPEANAYFFVGEPQNEWHDGNPTHQTCMIQFYRITADISKRLMRSEQLCHDYERMMKLLEKEGKAA